MADVFTVPSQDHEEIVVWPGLRTALTTERAADRTRDKVTGRGD